MKATLALLCSLSFICTFSQIQFHQEYTRKHFKYVTSL
jgi:hypothetical protein